MSKKLDNLKNEFDQILKLDRKMKISIFKKKGLSAINNMYTAKKNVQKIRKTIATRTDDTSSATKLLEKLEEQSDDLFDKLDDMQRDLSPTPIQDLNHLKSLKPNPKLFVKGFGETQEQYEEAFEECKQEYILANKKYKNHLKEVEAARKNLDDKQKQIILDPTQYQSKVISHLNQALSDLNSYAQVKHSKSSDPELQNKKTAWIKKAIEYDNHLIKKYSNIKRELDKIIILVKNGDPAAWKSYKRWEKFDDPLE